MNRGLSPLHILTDFRFQARWLQHCRLVGISEDEVSSGWDVENEFNAEGCGWAERVKTTIPHIEEDEMFLLHRIEHEIKAISDKVGVPSS